VIDLLVANASQILTCGRRGEAPPLAGKLQGEVGLVAGAVAIDKGRIVEVGPEAQGLAARETLDALGGVLLPGFVDCHTHAVFAGNRVAEFEERARGVSYEEISKRGGGIKSSVRMLREATDADLAAQLKRHLDRFLDLGTTTIEAKSGYGLSLEHELRSLRALGIAHEVEVVRTCLAAHTIPPEFAEDRDGYIRIVCDEILPAAAERKLAEFCDVFCERNVFTFAEAEKILRAGKACGLRPKIHADQLSRQGGCRVACRVGAISADHLEFVTKDDAVAMREAGVIAVLLPAANYFLDQPDRPPTRAIIMMNCPIALATDFNPGSAPTQSMPFVINAACVRFGMTVAEAIVAATINAACAIGRQKEIGSLEKGKQADLIVLDLPDYRELGYWFGEHPVRAVVKRGRVVRSRA